jgi:aerobic-type carbon monoxide dehydrogenase small subunit (CoxS/CutS family)
MNTARLRAVINGREIEREVPVRQTLAEFLRDGMGLTGTKLSCEMQVCGVCAVLVDGDPISSCTYLAVDIDQRRVTTIEGLTDGDELNPIQSSFLESFALQCGFCTPGFVVMATALLAKNQRPTADDVAEYLEGNICRCTGYRPIIDAIVRAAATGPGQ